MAVVPLATLAAELARSPSGDTLAQLRARFGGKAIGLAHLLNAGLPVPEAVILDGGLFTLALAHDPELSSTGPDVEAALAGAWNHMRRGGHRLLAVRSSGAMEDGEDASFAGQAETVLGVTSLPGLRDAVLRCYRSGSGLSARAYLALLHGASSPLPAMAVVVQAQIRPDVAGVLFTADPRSGEPAILINASYGVGEALVSGLVSPDAFALAPLPPGPVLRGRRLGAKATATHIGPRGDRSSLTVSPARRRRFCMGDNQLLRLAQGAIRLAAGMGRPQDIEFAVAGDRIWFLQSRPLTALPADPGPAPAPAVMGNAGGLPDAWGYNDSLSGDYLWTNVNVGEGLPGVLTPFSWGLVRIFFDLAARHVFGVLAEGVPLFGNIYGRLYLNLSGRASVARALAWVLPGQLFERLAKVAWEDIWGLIPEGLGLPLVPVSPAAVYAALPRSAVLFGGALWRYQTRFRRFRDKSLASVASLRRLLAETAEPAALARFWTDQIEPRLLLAGTMVMFTAAATAASQKQLAFSRPVLRYGDEAAMSRIMAGVGGLESVAPAMDLWRLSRVGAALPELALILRSGEPDGRLATAGFRDRVRSLPGGAVFVDALDHFMERHGHRSDAEFESAGPAWAEDPTPVLSALRLFLDLPETDGPVAAQESRSREAAEELDRIRSRAGWRTGVLARQMVRIHHANLLRREEARSLLVLWASLGRSFALAAGRVLAAHGCLGRVDQVFYLEVGEVLEALQGAAGPSAAGWADVAGRREERYRYYVTLPDPPSVFRGPLTAGELGRSTRSTGRPGQAQTRDCRGRTQLRGLPASPGIVRGLVRRLDSPRQAGLVRHGDVLVTRSANVGWTIIFQTLGAVVTDVGAPFSHAAIVMRELHRCAVVDTKLATAVLGDGDLVEVDGVCGLVTRLVRRRIRRRWRPGGQRAGPGDGWRRFGRANPVRRGVSAPSGRQRAGEQE